MQINPVIEAIYAAFKIEVANQFFLTNNSLVIHFPNQTRAVINALQVRPVPVELPLNTPSIPNINGTHTFHYLHQHDFDQGDTQLLTLQSIADCRAYLADVCENLLNVINRDFEIEFSDGTAFLLTIEQI